MSDKKHIDRLFQEKFKDFEAKPNANVWGGIESKMNQQSQEKAKKGFPAWLRFASIAAALVLLFAVGNLIFNNENTDSDNKTTVIDVENKTPNIEDTSTNKNVSTKSINPSEENNIKGEQIQPNLNKTSNNTTIVTGENKSKENKASEGIQKNNSNSQSIYAESNLKQKNESSNNYVANQKNNGIVSTVNSTNNNTSNNSESVVQNNSGNNISTEKSNINSNKNNVDNSVLSNSANNKTVLNNSNTKLANNTNIETKQSKTEAQNVSEKNTATANATVAKTDNEKEKEEEKLMNPDSANSSETIEEALAKIEDLDEKEEENVNRWTINTNVAPVYYNTLGKGSHIHEEFINNPKNGEINTSYGINVGYSLNNRLKVRSGINKLNLSYDTANVIIYENVTNTPSSSPLRNINFVPTSNGQNISVLSANNFSVQQINDVFNDNLNAALSQRLSYMEVPLELEYAVVKKRFGLHLIGGFSTFFLNDNEVVTEVENRKTKIGEANNINNVSFSANAGVGIDYKFSNAVKFNLEPTFKYQLNAYNETSGNFRPYIIGVYTGISYKF